MNKAMMVLGFIVILILCIGVTVLRSQSAPGAPMGKYMLFTHKDALYKINTQTGVVWHLNNTVWNGTYHYSSNGNMQPDM